MLQNFTMKKVIAASAGIAMALSFAGSSASLVGAQFAPGAASALSQFNADLTIGSSNSDVSALQSILVTQGYLVMPMGVNKGYFGALTKAAVAKWQAAVGIVPAVGFFGPISRLKMNDTLNTIPNPNPLPPTAGCPAGAVFNYMT
ncbi:MAG: peptidoglycan-binding domain-containing protein, partial [Candidatus Taylorbacteria bacterium]